MCATFLLVPCCLLTCKQIWQTDVLFRHLSVHVAPTMYELEIDFGVGAPIKGQQWQLPHHSSVDIVRPMQASSAGACTIVGLSFVTYGECTFTQVLSRLHLTISPI